MTRWRTTSTPLAVFDTLGWPTLLFAVQLDGEHLVEFWGEGGKRATASVAVAG